MFESNPNIMEQITIGLIFDNTSFTAEEQSKIEDLLSLRHNGLYATSNTTRNSEYLIARPDVTLTAALTQEILTKRVQIKYVGTNLIANLGDYFETPEEIIKNYNNEQINKLLERVINFRYHSDRVANSQNGKNAIVFANCIRGQSYLNKLKKIDLTKATTDRYKIERIKELELELLEGRMDNTIVLKIVDVEYLTVIYYVITNKHSWKKVRKMSGKIIPLFPESVVEGINKEFKDKIEFLGEKLGTETNDNTAWQETFISILNDNSRVQQKMIIDIEKLLENTKKEEIYNLQRNITRYKTSIRDSEQAIRNSYEEIRNLEGKLLRIDQDPELKNKLLELMEFINKSKLISDFKIYPDSHKATILINAPIKYYDQNYAKAMFKNMHTSGSRTRKNDYEIFKKLFEDIFINEKYTLMTSTKVDLFFYRQGYSPLTYNIARYGSNMPFIGQPHLDGFNCLGNNQITASQQCNEFDLLGLVNLLTNCAQNFNLTDSTVFNHFRNELLDSDKNTIIVNETGELIAFKDYYEKITTKPLEVPEVIIAHEKYGNQELNDSELDYIFKGFSSFKKIYTTPQVALQIARKARENNIELRGPAASTTFFYEALNNNHAVVLRLQDNALFVGYNEDDYYNLYEKYKLTNNDEQLATFYTLLLDDYYTTINTIVEDSIKEAIEETVEEITNEGPTPDYPQPIITTTTGVNLFNTTQGIMPF